MGRLRGELVACLILSLLTLVCFARLVANPSGLMVDGERPSVDHAQRDDFRPVGNDLTFFYLPHYLRVADQVAKLDRASERTLPYPYWHQRGYTERNPIPV